MLTSWKSHENYKVIIMETKEDIIILVNKQTISCDEGCGIVGGLSRISRSRWENVTSIIDRLVCDKNVREKDFQMKKDCSSGGHGCVIYFNIADVVRNIIVLSDQFIPEEIIDTLNIDKVITMIEGYVLDLDKEFPDEPNLDQNECPICDKEVKYNDYTQVFELDMCDECGQVRCESCQSKCC
jgi:hypothetical protein